MNWIAITANLLTHNIMYIFRGLPGESKIMYIGGVLGKMGGVGIAIYKSSSGLMWDLA